MNLIKYFIYSNWHLFIILGLDFITSLNLTFYTSNLSVDDTSLLLNFNNLCGNIIYLLGPLGNISLKLAKNKTSIKYLIIFNIFLVLISTFILQIITYYKNNNLYNSELNNFYLLFYNLFTKSLLSILNYYLIGTNNITILLKFNIFNMLFNHFIIRYVINYVSLYKKIILVNLGDLLSIIYMLNNLGKASSYKNLNYYECFQLMIKNSMSIVSLNINNNITSNMNRYEIKKYHYLSSNFYSFTLLYNPISLAIKKNDFPKKFLIKLCTFYYLFVMLLFNIYFYYNQINLNISNIYLLLYYIVLLLESESALDGDVNYGIKVNIVIIISKLIYKYFTRIDNMNNYYFFINLFFILRILLKVKKKLN